MEDFKASRALGDRRQICVAGGRRSGILSPTLGLRTCWMAKLDDTKDLGS